jgi:hypothetical protein
MGGACSTHNIEDKCKGNADCKNRRELLSLYIECGLKDHGNIKQMGYEGVELSSLAQHGG